MKGPISGIRYIHKAIRTELGTLEEAARRLEAGDGQQIAELADRFSFLRTTVRAHSDGEEDVLLPALDEKAYHVSTPYVLDHQAKDRLFDEIVELLTSLQSAQDADPRLELVRRLNRQIVALNATLSQHVWKEEEHLAPLAEETFSIEEQGALVGRSVQHFPPQLMQQVLPWMLRALTPDEQEDHLRMMMQGTPPDRFSPMAQWIAKGVPHGQWMEMVRRIPELASAAG